jgi:hypothetical protein
MGPAMRVVELLWQTVVPSSRQSTRPGGRCQLMRRRSPSTSRGASCSSWWRKAAEARRNQPDHPPRERGTSRSSLQAVATACLLTKDSHRQKRKTREARHEAPCSPIHDALRATRSEVHGRLLNSQCLTPRLQSRRPRIAARRRMQAPVGGAIARRRTRRPSRSQPQAWHKAPHFRLQSSEPPAVWGHSAPEISPECCHVQTDTA